MLRTSMGQYYARYLTITFEEKKIISDSFALLRKNKLKDCGTALYLILSRDYPQIIEHFPVSAEKDKIFEKQCTQYMNDLGILVKNIEKPTTLLQILTAKAKKDIPRSFTMHDYDKIRQSILNTFVHQLGPAVFGDKNSKSWNKGLTVLFGVLYSIIQDLEHPSTSWKK